MKTEKSSGSKTKVVYKDFKPTFCKVILLNDSITTMDFVVGILIEIFNKNNDEAISLMFKIHTQGNAVCGVYPKDIAKTKQMEVLNLARKYGFPLQCILKDE